MPAHDPEPTSHLCAGCVAALPERAARLKVKLVKLKEEMGNLAAYEKQMLAAPDSKCRKTFRSWSPRYSRQVVARS